MIAAAADALARWEPRIRVSSASLSVGFDGSAVITVEAADVGTGAAVSASASLGASS